MNATLRSKFASVINGWAIAMNESHALQAHSRSNPGADPVLRQKIPNRLRSHVTYLYPARIPRGAFGIPTSFFRTEATTEVHADVEPSDQSNASIQLKCTLRARYAV
jgi:hypothetical protein